MKCNITQEDVLTFTETAARRQEIVTCLQADIQGYQIGLIQSQHNLHIFKIHLEKAQPVSSPLPKTIFSNPTPRSQLDSLDFAIG